MDVHWNSLVETSIWTTCVVNPKNHGFTVFFKRENGRPTLALVGLQAIEQSFMVLDKCVSQLNWIDAFLANLVVASFFPWWLYKWFRSIRLSPIFCWISGRPGIWNLGKRHEVIIWDKEGCFSVKLIAIFFKHWLEIWILPIWFENWEVCFTLFAIDSWYFYGHQGYFFSWYTFEVAD